MSKHKIQMLGILFTYCVIGDYDCTLGEVQFHSSIRHSPDLTPNTLITTNPNCGRTPPFGRCDQKQGEELLGQSLPGVIPVLVDQIQWQPKELLEVDARIAGQWFAITSA
jgi:hypothetical protein